MVIFEFFISQYLFAPFIGEGGYVNSVRDAGAAPALNEPVPVDYPFELTNGNAPAGKYRFTITYEGSRNFNSVSKTVTLKIEPKAISAVFSGHNNLVYDGTEKRVSAALQGVAEGDELTPTFDYKGQTPKNAGLYTVSVSVDNPNYTLVGTTNLTYAIAKKQLTIYVKSFSLVDGAPKYELAFGGFVDGEGADDLDKLPTAGLLSKNAGENKVVLTGGYDNNYEFRLANERNATYIINPSESGRGDSILYLVLGVIGCLAVIIIIVVAASKRKKGRLPPQITVKENL